MKTQGSQREDFLDRIRRPLERVPGAGLTEPAPAVDLARLADANTDVLEMFVANAHASGMHVHRTNSTDLAGTVVKLLEKEGAKRIVMCCAEDSAVKPLSIAIRAAGVATIDWSAPGAMDKQFDLDAGLTDVCAVFAETGTLVCTSDELHSRGASLVPPVHLAVVRRSDILPDMLDYFASLKGQANRALPSSIAFITGPSKTADIEGILITGVHGPGTVHVIVVEDA